MAKLKVGNLVKKVKGMWKTPPEGRYLNIKEIGTFGLYALGNSFISTGIAYVVTIAFIPYFYGINQVHSYIIMGLGTLLNLLLQPILGSLMEKTNTKFGRYKPFILYSLPLFSLFAVLSTFLPQFEMEKSRVIYAYCCCVPAIVLQTFSNNMYNTMPTIITPVAQERADIMTPIGLITGFAPSIMQIFVGFIRGYFLERGQEYMGMRIIGIIATAIGFMLVLSIIYVKERVHVLNDKDKQNEKVGFSSAVRMLFKNKPLIILFIALTIGSLRDFVKQFFLIIIQVRFHENTVTALKLSGFIQSIVGFAATIAMLTLPLITRKFSKHICIIIYSVIGAISYLALGIIGYQNIAVGMPSVILITILFFLSTINSTYLLVPILLGELCDYQQMKTGKRLEGYIQALLFSIPTLVSFLLMICTLFIQKDIGFELKDYQNQENLSVLQKTIAAEWFNAASIISGISGFLMIIVLAFYPLNKNKYKETLDLLKEQSNIEIQTIELPKIKKQKNA